MKTNSSKSFQTTENIMPCTGRRAGGLGHSGSTVTVGSPAGGPIASGEGEEHEKCAHCSAGIRGREGQRSAETGLSDSPASDGDRGLPAGRW